eukprot:1339902-Amphidinium_carterae.1
MVLVSHRRVSRHPRQQLCAQGSSIVSLLFAPKWLPYPSTCSAMCALRVRRVFEGMVVVTRSVIVSFGELCLCLIVLYITTSGCHKH